MKILILPGDGIGPEIIAQAVKALNILNEDHGLGMETETALVGGAAIDAHGTSLPEDTLRLAKQADAVLLGAVGGPKWDSLPMEQRAEQGLLGLRAGLGLFANLRPAILYPQLAQASTLKPQFVENLDLMIVRELTGGIYFGKPRGIREAGGEREGYNTLVYKESEIRRIGEVAFQIARLRDKRVCSVDKANVLESTRLWRQVMESVAGEYADVELSHMYVDNAAMQLVKAPKQFDVMVTTNMFGDILSDCAAMLTGSIGMLPSASLDQGRKGMYEPIHGSAPDIAGKDLANPIATVLSLAMMMRYTFDRDDVAGVLEKAVNCVLDQGLRTPDLAGAESGSIGCSGMGDAIARALRDR